MYSKLLQEHGLTNLVGGRNYNFRSATAKEQFKPDVQRLLKEANLQPKEIYTGKQVHDTHVAYADGEMGEDFVIGKHFTDTDGLITDKTDIALLIKYADCTPIVLYDPVRKVQASVHSGWRGTAQKISHAAIEKMTHDFGSKKDDILAYVGPSIDQENYEVGPEVYEAFAGEPARDLYFKPSGEKYLLSMSEANYQSLLHAGISPKNIEIESTSTYTSDALHSARKEGQNYGLNAIVTMMEDD